MKKTYLCKKNNMKKKDFLRIPIADNHVELKKFAFDSSKTYIGYGHENFDFSMDSPSENVEMQHMHTHEFYMIAWIKEGNYDYDIDMNKYHVMDNTLLFVAPGQYHFFENVINNVGTAFFFTEDFFCNILPNLANKIKFSLFDSLHLLRIESEETKDRISSLFQLLSSLLNNKERDTMGDMAFYSCLSCLLCNIMNSREFNGGVEGVRVLPEKHELYLQYLNLVENNYKTCHLVKYYAQELNVSQKILTLCTEQNAHKTPLIIIRERLLLEAKRLLLYSDLRISNIAYELGFCEPSHFVKFFGKHMGDTPSQFRESSK